MRKISIIFVIACSLALTSESLVAGAPGNASGSSASSQQPASAPAANSVTFDLHRDKTLDTGPTDYPHAMFCFTAEQVDSSTQPIIVVAADASKDAACTDPRGPAPLTMGMDLYFRIDFSRIRPAAWQDIKLVTVGLTSAASSPINPTPVRAGISQPTSSLPGAALAAIAPDTPAQKFFRWPYRLSGDTVLNVSASVLYTPPFSMTAPITGRYYPVGSVVVSSPCYAAIAAVMGAVPPDADTAHWVPLSSCVPSPDMQTNAYAMGSLVSVTGGMCFYSNSYIPVSGDPTAAGTPWKSLLSCAATPWTNAASYMPGSLVFLGSPENSQSPTPVCYVALKGNVYGTTGAVQLSPATWARLLNCPQVQATTSEASIQLINQTLPPVHALSRFNLAAGVVYSSIRSRAYGFYTINTPPTPTTYCASATSGTSPNTSTTYYGCNQTSSSKIVDPVLFATYYIWPIDAERGWQWKDLRPGVSLGFSMSSPTSNFYFGLSHEFPRNVQIVWGFTLAKVPHLAPTWAFNAAPSGNSAAPATVQRFDKGVFIGLSFDILGFIQGLTGAGGGAGH